MFCVAANGYSETREPQAERRSLRPSEATVCLPLLVRLNSHLALEVLDRLHEPLLELYLRLPSEQRARFRDVGLTDFRVVNRQILVDDLALRPSHLE